MALTGVAHGILRDSNATGFIHVRDVNSGRVLAHVSTSSDATLGVDSPLAPLSVIKVYLAAIWLERGFGSTSVDCAAGATHPIRHMLVEEVLISGCDSAAMEMATILRREIGASVVLGGLHRYGLNELTLKPDASDTEWGRVLSLGEEEVPVTPQQMSAFFRAIGQGGANLVSPQTASRLTKALDDVVQRGTATSIKDVLTNTDWHIGGKTGTGPGDCGDHCDGWFASLASDPHGARYVVLVFIRGRGLGSGVAAHSAASMAEYLAAHNPTASAQ
jgi:Penicillin binding protein transpeptidase domain